MQRALDLPVSVKCLLVARMRAVCAPQEAVPTGDPPCLRPLPTVRAVLFDLYGTLLLNAVDRAKDSQALRNRRCFRDALRASGFLIRDEASIAVIDRFRETKRARAATLRTPQNPFPEQDVRDLLRLLLEEPLTRREIVPPAQPPEFAIARLAVEYFCRAERVWPMPGSLELLTYLRRRRIPCGIVSNAQWFAPWYFEAILGATPAALGIAPSLTAWSFEHGSRKPDLRLFQVALQPLQDRLGISPCETLYVGNDLSRDIAPAAQLGMQTAHLVADKRSRVVHPHDGLAAARPDVVLTEFVQLIDLLKVRDDEFARFPVN